MIDWDRVAELQEEVGEEDFGEVVGMFFEEVEEVLERLGADPATLPRDLHFLKGSALNLGFSAMSAHCRAAEPSAEKAEKIPDIKTSYAAAKSDLAAVL